MAGKDRDDIAIELVRKIISDRGTLPTKVDCYDDQSGEIYSVIVTKAKTRASELFEKLTKSSIGGGGGRCECCDGTGKR